MIRVAYLTFMLKLGRSFNRVAWAISRHVQRQLEAME